ncbi:hypothetical protein ACLB2K_062627 [Fragaria x ananassa]
MQNLRDMFSVYDIDRSDSISTEELFEMLKSLGDESSITECRKMIGGFGEAFWRGGFAAHEDTEAKVDAAELGHIVDYDQVEDKVDDAADAGVEESGGDQQGCRVDVRTLSGLPSVLHLPAQATARLHPRRFQQRPRPLPLPGESLFFQFPARSILFEVLGDLAGKPEKNGLAGEGKWSGTLFESSGVEARRRRRRRVENGRTSAL